MIDTKMRMNRCNGKEMVKKRLDKLVYKTYGSTTGITFERTPESKYSVTMRKCMIYPAYFKGTYWQDYTLFVSDAGVLMQKLVDYGNEYGDFTEENWDDIARLTRWLVDGGQEFKCGFGTIRRLEGDEDELP